MADALSRTSYPKQTEQDLTSKDAYNAHLEIGSELLSAISANRTVEMSFDYETPPASTPAGNVVASLEDVTTQQQNCNDLKPIVAYLTSGELPADDKQAKRLAYESQYYVIENGALYHLYENKTKDVSKATGRKRNYQTTCRPSAKEAKN